MPLFFPLLLYSQSSSFSPIDPLRKQLVCLPAAEEECGREAFSFIWIQLVCVRACARARWLVHKEFTDEARCSTYSKSCVRALCIFVCVSMFRLERWEVGLSVHTCSWTSLSVFAWEHLCALLPLFRAVLGSDLQSEDVFIHRAICELFFLQVWSQPGNVLTLLKRDQMRWETGALRWSYRL